MSNHELIAMVLAFIGGLGGLASFLAWMDIVDSLNSQGSSGDQIIPPAIASLLREFHERFPDSPSHYWCLGGLAWLFSFLLAGAVMAWH